MYAAFELGEAVRTRRTDMGLTQTALSKLSGLSRVTVNQLENCTLKDLSITRTAQLLGALGLSLSVTPPRRSTNSGTPSTRMTALERLAQSSSVSYRTEMQASVLGWALEHGQAPVGFAPHVNAVLEDGSVPLLAAAVEEIHLLSGVERSKLWMNLRSLARQFDSRRELWRV